MASPQQPAAPMLAQEFQHAVAQHQAGQLQEAGALYLHILQAQPDHPDANFNMGLLAVQMNQPAAGLPYFSTALDADPTRARYWLGYIDALFQAGQHDDARQILTLARQQGLQGDEVDALATRLEGGASSAALSPDDADTHFNLGIAFKGRGQLEEAAASYRRALKINPDLAAASYNLGNTLKDLGRLDEAAASYRRALRTIPNNAMVHSNLGAVLQELGRFGDAEVCLKRALHAEPDYADAHYNLGITLHSLHRLDEAETCYRRALEINPVNAEAHFKLGSILYDSKRLDEAEASYRQALAIKADFGEAHNNLGLILKALGRLDEAEASYRRALHITPDYAEAHSNLGGILRALGRLGEAEISYRRALQINPDLAEAHNNLGNTLNRLGRLDESEACLRRTLQLKPDYAEAHVNLGATLMDLGRPHEAVASYRRALKINWGFVEVHDNLLFALNLHPSEQGNQNEEIRVACQQYNEQYCLPHRAEWQRHHNNRDSNRRLRIGYVSPDFRCHAVAFFAEPIFATHDKSQVEIFCYAEVTAEDDYTARFRKLADHWHSTVGLSDDQVADMIREHQIDILVDLAGHSASNRLLVFARKPAPLQLTYLGYPGTTGLSTMDYRLTDRHADPEGLTESHYVEHLLRLPDSLYCYRPSADMPEPSVLPALARGYLTFGSFNNPNKIDQRTLHLWAELLRTLPTAHLMMLTMPEGELRLHWVRRFEELGIDAQRLEFHSKLPVTEFHRKFLDVDISLDTVSCSGGTTTCESLWMGVPVIASVGERFITRVSHSCLNTVGLAEFSAASPEDYVRIAIRYADKLPQLAEIRAGLRNRVRTSPLIDEVRFTRNLENIYRDIWSKWCSA